MEDTQYSLSQDFVSHWGQLIIGAVAFPGAGWAMFSTGTNVRHDWVILVGVSRCASPTGPPITHLSMSAESSPSARDSKEASIPDFSQRTSFLIDFIVVLYFPVSPMS